VIRIMKYLAILALLALGSCLSQDPIVVPPVLADPVTTETFLSPEGEVLYRPIGRTEATPVRVTVTYLGNGEFEYRAVACPVTE